MIVLKETSTYKLYYKEGRILKHTHSGKVDSRLARVRQIQVGSDEAYSGEVGSGEVDSGDTGSGSAGSSGKVYSGQADSGKIGSGGDRNNIYDD